MSDNLGRIVAAERNAISAIQGVTELRDENATLKQQVLKLQLESAELRTQINSFNGLLNSLRGSGATER